MTSQHDIKNNYPATLFKRHCANFEKMFPCGKKARVPNDAQAMLYFVWAFFVLSHERLKFLSDEFEDFKVFDITSLCDGEFRELPIEPSEKIAFMRHAISHGNFIFHLKKNKKIYGFTFWSAKPNKKSHQAAFFKYSELLKLLRSLKFSEKSQDIGPVQIVEQADNPEYEQKKGKPLKYLLDKPVEEFVRSIDSKYKYIQTFGP